MHATAALANAASFSFAVVLAGHVILRRRSSPLRRPAFGLLLGIALWTGGAAWRQLAHTRPELLVAFGVLFLGVCLVPPLWLLLAARISRPQILEERPDRIAAVAAPGLLFYAAFLTNERHGAFARIGLDGFEYGPLFWAMVVWGYLCVLGGAGLLLHRARGMAREQQGARALLLVLVASVPLLASGTYLAGLLPWSFDPTPASLGISTALLFPMVLRMSLLEDLPLVRRDVIEHLGDGVLIADSDGTILDANPAAAALLGTPARSLRRARLDGVLRSLVVAEDRPALARALDAGVGSRAPVEVRDGSGRHIRLCAARVRSREGQPGGRFVVLHDCTDERLRDQALRRARQVEGLGLLAAGIAHEVNNPLAFVRTNLHQLERAVRGSKALCGGLPAEEAAALADVPELVAESIEGVERIARIVASVGRLARDDVASEGDAVDVNHALREAVKLAQIDERHGPELALDPALPPVGGSKDGLVQVFLNLLVNARHALAERPGGIRVASRLRDGFVELRIEDDGPGIPEALQDRIFDPFFTTKGPAEGTGLGLAIAFDIVRAHRGTLAVASSPDRGACFTIRLPAALPPA